MIVTIKVLSILLLVSPLVLGQQPGQHTPEVHPKLTWQQCKAGGQCSTHTGGVVIDAQWRWLHDSHDKNCFSNGKPDPAVCADIATCEKNCQYEGADYAGYGVKTSGSSLHQTLKPGSRLYLTTNDSTKYELFHLLDQEFTFDVDTSKVPCGGNGALYLVSMEADGGMSKNPNNKAGAKYGMGYCDAQCAKNMNFIQADHGACCSEMDIWEANKMASVLTPHPCTPAPYTLCTGSACSNGICESGGCGLNPYSNGNHNFYGPGKTVDTSKVFTVVTQFITSGGHLSEIRRFYVQNNKVIPDTVVSEQFCQSHGGQSFQTHGGLKQMGTALKAGMVLAFALWDDAGGHMQWLDGGNNGPCQAADGAPSVVESHNPYVVWSHMRVGPINSTFTHH